MLQFCDFSIIETDENKKRVAVSMETMMSPLNQ